MLSRFGISSSRAISRFNEFKNLGQFCGFDVLLNPPGLEKHFQTVADHYIQESNFTLFMHDLNIWKETLHDFFYIVAVDPKTKDYVCGIYGAADEKDENGERLYGMGGLYTIPECRRTGIGFKIFELGLDFVVSQNENAGFYGICKNNIYRKYAVYGADKFHAHYTMQLTANVEDLSLPERVKGLIVKDFTELEWTKLSEFDKTVSTRRRDKFLKARLEPTDYQVTKIVVDEANDRVKGLASFRRGNDGRLIAGPIYSDSKEAAALGINACIKTFNLKQNTGVEFRYPQCNAIATDFFAEISNHRYNALCFARTQFSGKLVHHHWDKIFSISSFAFAAV